MTSFVLMYFFNQATEQLKVILIHLLCFISFCYNFIPEKSYQRFPTNSGVCPGSGNSGSFPDSNILDVVLSIAFSFYITKILHRGFAWIKSVYFENRKTHINTILMSKFCFNMHNFYLPIQAVPGYSPPLLNCRMYITH